MEVKRPAFQFYPGDWLQDAELRMCSMASRGLWIDMIALMHQAKPYGHLVFNGKKLEPAQLARLVGEGTKDVQRWLEELDGANVYSRTADGVIYSRRMVRDEAIRNKRAIGGILGAEHGLKGAGHGSKGGRPLSTGLSTSGVNNPPSDTPTPSVKGSEEPPIKPPPSSSSSSSRDTPSQVSQGTAAAVDNPQPPERSSKSKQRASARADARGERVLREAEQAKIRAMAPDTPLPAAIQEFIRPKEKPEPIEEPVQSGLTDEEPAIEGEIPWWHSPAGITRAGTERGVFPKEDEDWLQFADRVMAAAGPGPWDHEVPADRRERIEDFRAMGGA